MSSCKGEFLAALATMSLLTISSRHCGHPETNSVIFHNSTVISRLVPAPIHQEIRGGHGTRVTVNNLFGNMPVRIKHRASSLRRSEDVDKEWEELTRMLVALVLSNSGFQKLRLSDREKSRSLNIRIPQGTTKSTNSESQISSLVRVHTILAQSGLTLGTSVDEWVRMSASTLEISVKAYVALGSSPTRLNQFISLGINPIFNEHKSANVLYDEINQVFAGSDFGSVPAVSRLRESRLQGTMRGTRRWPIFYIRIDINSSLKELPRAETTVESDRALQHIVEVLQAMFYQFLQQHHYRPRKRKRVERDALTSHSRDSSTVSWAASGQRNRDLLSAPSMQTVSASSAEAFDSGVPATFKNESSQYFNDFTNWSRVKVGESKATNDLLVCRPSYTSRPQTGTSILEYEATSPDFAPVQAEKVDHASHTMQDAGDQMTRWIDPSTNKVILVNSRTGQCVTESQGIGRPNSSIGFVRPRSATSMLSHAGASIKRPQTVPAQSYSPWLDNLVHKCANIAFSCPEKPIMSIENGSPFDDSFRSKDAQMRSQQCWNSTELVVNDRHNGKLSREALSRATIIAQVDRKFILVRMTPLNEDRSDNISTQVLVLVDQHAADERCRLEQLLSDMFSVDEGLGAISIRTHQFPTPIQYPIQEEEISSLAAYSKFFESWGCLYRVHQELLDGRRHYSIIIEALPLVIAERCRLEPQLFLQLLRKEIWSRAGERIPSLRSTTSIPSPTMDHENRPYQWLRWLAGCPEGILDLINSRACRSSIMFNDSLRIEECQGLISRLSKCAFPFQCAHGRPTMIPIVDERRHLSGIFASSFGGEISFEDRYYDPPGRQAGFVEAFKKWERT